MAEKQLHRDELLRCIRLAKSALAAEYVGVRELDVQRRREAEHQDALHALLDNRACKLRPLEASMRVQERVLIHGGQSIAVPAVGSRPCLQTY